VHTLFVLPDDPSSIPVFMAPVLALGGAVLVLTRDAESAVAIAAALDRPDVLAATTVARASRVTPAAIVVGPSDVILGLVSRSKLKLDSVAALVLAWVDVSQALEAVVAEVPKDAARVIVTTAVTPQVEALVERYARRPRRVVGATAPVAPLAATWYVTVTAGTRPTALRRLLDDLDPPSAFVYTRTDRSEREVREILNALGYGGAGATVRVARGVIAETAALVVLYDIPLDANEMAAIVQSAPVQVVALAERRELARLPGAKPLALSGPLQRAKERVDEIRQVLAAGAPAAEVAWLEPLLDSYDGIEIAAAALHLLGRVRHPVEQQQQPVRREATARREAPPRHKR
jgi:hypothetical protein